MKYCNIIKQKADHGGRLSKWLLQDMEGSGYQQPV
ncbi:hypothetical protein QFZ51_000886 [Chitinophaga sp. W3I9]